jgi:hypothetical protein
MKLEVTAPLTKEEKKILVQKALKEAGYDDP